MFAPTVVSEVTLSALNAPEGDVDIEGLGDGGGHKKLDFDSGEWPLVVYLFNCFYFLFLGSFEFIFVSFEVVLTFILLSIIVSWRLVRICVVIYDLNYCGGWLGFWLFFDFFFFGELKNNIQLKIVIVNIFFIISYGLL